MFGTRNVDQYISVGASASAQKLGAQGMKGDFLAFIVIIPGTSAAGAVSIKDGGNSAITVFAGGGTTALQDLKPLWVPVSGLSSAGAWQITTGTNVTVLAVGRFTN